MNTQTDRELLELAAKAAGIGLRQWVESTNEFMTTNSNGWNPLTDDGDALRLAVQLQIHFGKYDSYASACRLWGEYNGEVVVWDHEEPDFYSATRRAIVRAAAEIGKTML
jgi:hypothetical protein